jgi:hypothetical protein
MEERSHVHGINTLLASDHTPADPLHPQAGLNAILGTPGTSQGSPTDMATHARIFYYAQRIGTTIDFSAYAAWLDRNPDHTPPDVLPEEHRSAASTSPLPWQQAAPKAALFVDKTAKTAEPAAPAGGDEPSYPMAFAEMIKLLQEGKPIPGIREIPNTIAREPVSAALPSAAMLNLPILTSYLYRTPNL